MEVVVSSAHDVSSAPFFSGAELFTLFSCSSMGALPQKTVLHELLQSESIPWAAALHELLHHGSLPQGVWMLLVPAMSKKYLAV